MSGAAPVPRAGAAPDTPHLLEGSPAMPAYAAVLWLLFCAATVVTAHYLDPHRDRS